ncbi:MAG: S8 family serine peptidase [Bacteroidota bacterium]
MEFFPDVVNVLNDAISTRALDFESFRIGLVSSGVDYTHPAFGGGLGEGFTVVGGYDFALNNSDPIDRYNLGTGLGFGTRWAGIIAGNAPNGFRGVAPGAKLVAYNVWGVGYGAVDDITEGILRTTDPNDDGDTSDHLFMAQFDGSLHGELLQPIRDAVREAADAGVLMVMPNVRSSEQNPNGYFTSHDAPEDVLSVGGVDVFGSIIFESAWGPTPSYTLKPDLVALAGGLYTTVPRREYDDARGLGAAISLVTGTMALIKAMNPDWSAAQVRSAVVNTTYDLERPMMQQGAGSLSIEDAIRATSTFEPAILRVGDYISSDVADVYQRTLPLTISNEGTEATTYRVVMPVPPVGVVWSISENNFTLQPGETSQVDLTFEMTKADAAFDPITFSMGDYFRIVTAEQTYRLPWYLVDQVAAQQPRTSTTVETETPTAFTVSGNYPNPFSATTNIGYTLADAAEVEIAVFNMVGQQVSSMRPGYQAAGQHEVMFEAGTLPSGMYYYHVSTGSERVTQTMTIVR